MTEITADTVSFLMPRPRPTTYLIDPVAFCLAVIGGPALVALLGFWVLFIPVFALVFGGPLYLAIGVPVLLIYLSRHQATIDGISFLAFLSFATFALPAMGVIYLIGMEREFATFLALVGFGLIFAPLWGMATGWIYLRLRRDFYAHPLGI